MGWLLDPEANVRHYLAERSMIGRASQCWTRIVHRSVSKEHAVLAFDEGCWTLKDLGSRNGTWVEGKRLESGEMVPVEREARLQFGDRTLALDTVEPPTLCARNEATGHYLVAESGLLSLPDDDSPWASAYESHPGSWFIDLEGETRPLQDGDTYYWKNQRFLLRVPSSEMRRSFESTVAAGGQLVLPELKLCLDVSRDGESITTRLLAEARVLRVPPRSTHQLLLVLGRQRQRDEAEGLTASECGWVYSDELATMMGADPQKVNLDVHRLRQQLASLGVLDAGRIVERRATSHQIRLGVAKIEIQ